MSKWWVAALAAFGALILTSWAMSQKNDELKKECESKGGILVHTYGEVACISSSVVIPWSRNL